MPIQNCIYYFPNKPTGVKLLVYGYPSKRDIPINGQTAKKPNKCYIFVSEIQYITTIIGKPNVMEITTINGEQFYWFDSLKNTIEYVGVSIVRVNKHSAVAVNHVLGTIRGWIKLRFTDESFLISDSCRANVNNALGL